MKEVHPGCLWVVKAVRRQGVPPHPRFVLWSWEDGVGGTTAAALRALEARAVRSAFVEAVMAAVERSRSMGR